MALLVGGGGSINGGYSSVHFKQSIKYEQTMSYTGRFLAPVPMALTLVVNCSPATSHMFVYLNDSEEPRVTSDKADQMNARLAREAKAKNRKLQELEERYILGEINGEQYDRLLELYSRITFTEDLRSFQKNGEMFSMGLAPDHLEALEKDLMK